MGHPRRNDAISGRAQVKDGHSNLGKFLRFVDVDD